MWQEQFKPGIVQHNNEKERSNIFTKTDMRKADVEKNEPDNRTTEDVEAERTSEPKTQNTKPGKFTDSVYETYESAPSVVIRSNL